MRVLPAIVALLPLLAHADGPPKSAEPPALRPAPLVPARGLRADVKVQGGDINVHFAFPVRVPTWFLWQHATACDSYLRSLPEIKKCQYLVKNGKPLVLLEGEILGKPYSIAV